MVINVIKYSNIDKNFKFVSSRNRIITNIEFKLYRVLMGTILVGVLLLLLRMIVEKSIISSIHVGGILVLSSIVIFLGIIIQSKMLKMINETYIQTVKSLIVAIECRDTYTSGHSEHVANLCKLICSKLQKEDLNVNLIEIAAYLHDIGKIGIPESILNKPEKLDDEEYNIIKAHPEMGIKIIENIDGLKEIITWILYHHERIDGKGYYNIPKENIPLESRIIAIADTFSALVTNRIYRKGMKYEEAIKIMIDSSESQFDSDVFSAFLSISIDELEKCIPSNLEE